jgi:hypothetical protein
MGSAFGANQIPWTTRNKQGSVRRRVVRFDRLVVNTIIGR